MPLVTKTVREHFADPVLAMRGDAWFDHDRVPLRWNLPIGVLSTCFRAPRCRSRSPFISRGSRRPRCCRAAPSTRSRTPTTTSKRLASSSTASKIIMNMGKSDHEKIGEALVKGDMKLFGEAAAHTFAPGGAEATRSLERLPVRILFSRGFTPALQKRSIMPSIKPKQPLVVRRFASGLSESRLHWTSHLLR